MKKIYKMKFLVCCFVLIKLILCSEIDVTPKRDNLIINGEMVS